MSLGGLQIGTAVAVAYGEDGFLGVQCDGFGKSPGANGRHVVGQFGLMGRPLDADGETGALCLFADEGQEGFAWIGFDGRASANVPPLTRGSTVLYNSRGAYQLLDHETETSTLYVPIAGGIKAHLMQIGKDSNDKAVIDIRHADGMAIIMLEHSLVIKNAAGDAYIELNDSGIVLNGNTKAVGGLDVGGGAALPITLAPPLVAYLQALNSALASIATIIDAKAPSAPGAVPIMSGFVASATAALAACTATLTKGL
jgi:hypothetical protein